MSKLKAIVLAVGIAALGGCASGPGPWMAENGMMSKADMALQGDKLIKDGTELKSAAAGLKPGEWQMLRSKEQMVTDGDKMISDGMAMKKKAAGM